LLGFGLSKHPTFFNRFLAASQTFEQSDSLLQFVVRINIDEVGGWQTVLCY
jgi:hypothetical protein